MCAAWARAQLGNTQVAGALTWPVAAPCVLSGFLQLPYCVSCLSNIDISPAVNHAPSCPQALCSLSLAVCCHPLLRVGMLTPQHNAHTAPSCDCADKVGTAARRHCLFDNTVEAMLHFPPNRGSSIGSTSKAANTPTAPQPPPQPQPPPLQPPPLHLSLLTHLQPGVGCPLCLPPRESAQERSWPPHTPADLLTALRPTGLAQLQALDLSGASALDELVETVATQCTSLQRLRLAGCASLSDAQLWRLAAGLPALKALDVSGEWVGGRAGGWHYCRRLLLTAIGSCFPLTQAGIAVLCTALPPPMCRVHRPPGAPPELSLPPLSTSLPCLAPPCCCRLQGARAAWCAAPARASCGTRRRESRREASMRPRCSSWRALSAPTSFHFWQACVPLGGT